MSLKCHLMRGRSSSPRFTILLTGELPCYASPNWKVSDKKEDLPKQNNSAMTEEGPEEARRIFLR